MYITQSVMNQSQRPNCSPYRMTQGQIRNSGENTGYPTGPVYGGSEPPFCWPQDPETQSRRGSGENVKQEIDNSQEELDMIANLISKDRLFLKRDPENGESERQESIQNSDLFGHSMHPGGSNPRMLRQSSGSTGEDGSPTCSPHQMYNIHQHHQQQNGVLQGMYQPSVDITGLLNQQFKSDSFDMSNFFGMSQINSHLPGSIANQMPSMALPFTAPPSMGLQNSMPVSASTSAGTIGRQNSLTSVGMKPRQRSGSDNLVKCSFCPKKFPSSQIDTHRNECRQMRCHECAQCGKRFKARGGLQQHNRIHLQERPYACRFCPKRFTQKSHLDQHERIHTGLKPFQCQYCGRSFRQRSQQIGHEATHPQGAGSMNTSMNSSSSSSGIFSANTTGSDSDQSCDNSPTNGKDKVSALQMAQNNAMLTMLAPNGNPSLLNLKQGTLELISGR